jgi:pSer/pThr/pTyr-binding forkhead associated (FHA) protein
MCGEPIEEATPSGTSTEPAMQQRQQMQQPYAHPSRQPDYSVPGAVQGRFVVQDTGATLPFPSGRTEFTVGREDPVSGIFPEIDLTDYGGDEGGVSRQHARVTIQGSQIFIEDMNSVNFTYVNRQKLTPGQPHRLNDGDEVQLGRVKLTFQA